MKKLNRVNQLLISILLVLVSSCAQTKTTGHNQAKNSTKEIFVACTAPRPEMCTREYMPVCAKRDTGLRCVTTPCPSYENITYSNGCSACSDVKVLSYRTGECAEKLDEKDPLK